jgi:hypothetical protein
VSAYTDFFLSARADAIQLELLEVTHPSFLKRYRIVRNARDGVTVSIPADGALPAEGGAQFTYYPCRVRQLSASDDLDAKIRVDLGDLGEVLPVELDAVEEAGGFAIKPQVRFLVYRSDDLTAPIFGPIHLEVSAISHGEEGASFDAAAPSLNVNRTGQLYRLETFPMLRGTL